MKIEFIGQETTGSFKIVDLEVGSAAKGGEGGFPYVLRLSPDVWITVSSNPSGIIGIAQTWEVRTYTANYFPLPKGTSFKITL